jgi:hypothetical protein
LSDPSLGLSDPSLRLSDPSLRLSDPSLDLSDLSLRLSDPSLSLSDPSLRQSVAFGVRRQSEGEVRRLDAGALCGLCALCGESVSLSNAKGTDRHRDHREHRGCSVKNSGSRGSYGCTHPAKFIWPFSILIIATGLIGLRSGPMVIVPATPS